LVCERNTERRITPAGGCKCKEQRFNGILRTTFHAIKVAAGFRNTKPRENHDKNGLSFLACVFSSGCVYWMPYSLPGFILMLKWLLQVLGFR